MLHFSQSIGTTLNMTDYVLQTAQKQHYVLQAQAKSLNGSSRYMISHSQYIKIQLDFDCDQANSKAKIYREYRKSNKNLQLVYLHHNITKPLFPREKMNPDGKRTSLYPKERAVCRTASFRSSVLSLILDILHHQPTHKITSISKNIIVVSN